MLCILYLIAVGMLLGLVGVLVERALPATCARRWLWCIIIPASLVLPGYYRMHHAVVVGDVLVAVDTGWWARIASYDPMINRAWFGASAVLVLWTLVNAGWVSRMVLLSRVGRRGKGGPAVVDGVSVVLTDSLGPATVGLWCSRILLPRWVLTLSGAQRLYVVRHEEEHRRAHDGRLLFFASLLLILVPWNLALWWQLRRLSLAVEMDCDNRVVRALGDAPAYGDLLVRIAQASSRGPRLQPALLGGVGMLERRLTLLLAPAPLRLAQRVLLPAAVGVLLFIVLAMPHPVIAKGHRHVPASPQVERPQ